MTVLQDLEGRQEALRKAVGFLNGWQEKSKKNSQVTAFFSLLAQGKWAAAKRVLDKIKHDADQTQWRRGYINALDGMVAALEGNEDQNTFIYQIKIEKIDEIKKTFFQKSRNGLHADFVRGYFSAWTDYTQMLNTTARLKHNDDEDNE